MYMQETMKLKQDNNLTFGIDFLEQNELNVMLWLPLNSQK